LKALRENDILMVWKLDRLARNLKDLVYIVNDLNRRNIGFKVLSGQGTVIDTTSHHGRLVFHIFAAIEEFERELIAERTLAGLASARARGRTGGRPKKLTAEKLQLAQAAMADPKTKPKELAKFLGISVATLYNYIGPRGELRSPAHITNSY
ncbi:MAG: recombinase family protein, partial [Holosporales bacterium]